MATYDVKAVLAEHFLLKHLPPSEMDSLARLVSTRVYDPNEVVFLKGDEGDAMMAVLSGRVRICAYSADGREIVLNVIQPGEVFGEIALIDGGPRTADAFAMDRTQLLILKRSDVMPFLERNPKLSVTLLEVMCARLRWTSAQVEDFFFLDLSARLAKRLLYLGKNHGEKTAEGGRTSVRFPQHLLAGMVGTSREAVNKQLRAWEDAGVVQIKRGSIILLKPEFLAHVLEEKAG
jgi:CRP-like cAMP-binding protein